MPFYTQTMSGSSSHTERLPAESPLLWPLLALLVIGVACFTYYWDGHRYEFPYATAHGPLVWPPPPESGAVNAAASTGSLAAFPAAPMITTLGPFRSLKLPDGVMLNAPDHGIESKLVAFIENPHSTLDTTPVWFDFDRLLFDFGKSTLQPASQEQLRNVAAIFKAFPNFKARIGGYTDSTGDPQTNLQLSAERAANVMHDLVTLGVSADRLDSRGYGSAHPIADNSTPEGRAENRRISLRVLAK